MRAHHRRMMRVTGRSDDMLIIRGVNVYPSQVEALLVGFPGLAPHYQLVLTREGPMDAVTVEVELAPPAPPRRAVRREDRRRRAQPPQDDGRRDLRRGAQGAGRGTTLARQGGAREGLAAGEQAMTLRVWLESDGRLLRLRLSRPKANLVDRAMTAALDAALDAHLDAPALAAVLIDAEGPHFSYGASIEEHLPAAVAPMLAEFHALVLRMVASPVTILVAVHGQCLGGGLELALAGHAIFVAPDAKLGQPEIKLGVLAPAGSCLLPEIVGPAHAFDLLVSGRSISGSEAVRIGLAREADADPAGAALAYFDAHLKGKSAMALRHAVKAARLDLAARVGAKLAAVERLYLDELMSTRDPIEGLEAFLAKRAPKWEHR